MGLDSAPGAFQKLMDLIISGLSYETALVYLDDVIIFGRTFEEHLERLELILCQLKEGGFKKKDQNADSFERKTVFLNILCRTTA